MGDLNGTYPTGHMPKNRYELIIKGVPPYPGRLVPTAVRGLERETESVTLPDRSQASGGQTKGGTMTIMIPLHDHAAQAYMHIWAKQGEAPVDPSYKKSITVIYKGIHFGSLAGGETNFRTLTVIGAWAKKPKWDDLEEKDEGNPVDVEWTILYDEVDPL